MSVSFNGNLIVARIEFVCQVKLKKFTNMAAGKHEKTVKKGYSTIESVKSVYFIINRVINIVKVPGFVYHS